MEYIFGTETRNGEPFEVVKVKSDKPIEMSGGFIVQTENDLETITDNFIVVKKIREAQADGIHYVWYEIRNHFRFVERFEKGIVPVKQDITDTQDALCEASFDSSSSIADIEDALCELTEV